MTVSTATTPGQILTSAYLNNNINSGLTYIDSATAAGTATPIDGCFTSTYNAYRIIVNATGTTSNQAMYLGLRVGGATNVTNNYKYSNWYTTTAAGSGVTANARSEEHTSELQSRI